MKGCIALVSSIFVPSWNLQLIDRGRWAPFELSNRATAFEMELGTLNDVLAVAVGCIAVGVAATWPMKADVSRCAWFKAISLTKP